MMQVHRSKPKNPILGDMYFEAVSSCYYVFTQSGWAIAVAKGAFSPKMRGLSELEKALHPEMEYAVDHDSYVWADDKLFKGLVISQPVAGWYHTVFFELDEDAVLWLLKSRR